MSSGFRELHFPATLASGQESFLGQLPLYLSGYADPLRHYPAPSGPGPAKTRALLLLLLLAGRRRPRPAAPCDGLGAGFLPREKGAGRRASGADEPPPVPPEPVEV